MAHRADQNESPAVGASGISGGRAPGGWAPIVALMAPALAFAIVAVSLFGVLGGAGLWDPHELRVAELGRRIAVNAYSAHWLVLEHADNSMVDLGDLRSGELPFTSVALGFYALGLGEWAGRLPLAIWGLAGVLATWVVVARFVDRVAAAFAIVILATMPLYYVQARTMLGDGVTMAAVAIAGAGLAIAVFDGVGRGPGWRLRGIGLLVGLLGLGAGYLCRGPVYGVAVPAGGVGLAWLLWHGTRRGGLDRLAHAVGATSLLLAVIGGVVTAVALREAFSDPSRFRLLVGVPLVERGELPTFDTAIRELGHGLFPYSGLIPFAIGRFRRGPETGNAAEGRQAALWLVLVAVAAVALVASGLLTTWTVAVPFVGVFAFAGIVALALRDLDRGAPVSAGLALGTVAFTVLIAWDLRNFPARSFAPFGIADVPFPDVLTPTLSRIAKATAVALGGIVFLALSEQDGGDAPRFRWDDYVRWPRVIWLAQKGNLFFAALVVEAALTAGALLTWLSQQFFHWRQLAGMSSNARLAALSAWVVFPVVLVLVPVLGLVVRDGVRELFDRIGNRRAGATLGAFVAAGLVLSLGYYPALARQLSPRSVFLTFRERAQPNEPLGLLGVGERSAGYYASGQVTVHQDPVAAFDWMQGGATRRWLVTRSALLPELNSLHRATHPGTNLPIVEAGSSEILLAVNELRDDEVNANPLADVVLDHPASPARPLDVNLAGRLEASGWEVVELDGTVVEEVVPGRSYVFRIYWRVLREMSSDWETFIHIDGQGQRHNGDHVTLGGRYPLRFWLPGDLIRDAHEFALEPNFAPGSYDVYFGLFIGSRRLEVQRGKHDDDRIFGGKLRVR